MRQFVVRGHAGMCGTDWAELTEAESEEEAFEQFESFGWDHFWQYNNEEDFDLVEPELDMWVEEYDPEEHDCIL